MIAKMAGYAFRLRSLSYGGEVLVSEKEITPCRSTSKF
jgi:hypothetical protein